LRGEQQLAAIEMIGAKPVKGRSSIDGPNCSAITMPTAVAFEA
jgi:hypothetical protein